MTSKEDVQDGENLATVQDKRAQKPWPAIVLFGDSITEMSWDPHNGCWAALVANKCCSYFDVHVRGFSGYNSKWAFEMLERQFPPSYLETVDVFFMFFGHNDSWESELPIAIPVSEFESNVRKIIAYLDNNGLDTRQKMILATPSWYHEPTADENFNGTATKKMDHAAEYASAIIRVASDLKIDYFDFFSISLQQPDLQSLFIDGVHFSKKGGNLFFEHLWPKINKKIKNKYGKDAQDLYQEIRYDQHPEVLASSSTAFTAQKP